MANSKLSKCILTAIPTLIVGIISIRLIIQLSQEQPLDIESETIFAYFDRLDTLERSTTTIFRLDTIDRSSPPSVKMSTSTVAMTEMNAKLDRVMNVLPALEKLAASTENGNGNGTNSPTSVHSTGSKNSDDDRTPDDLHVRVQVLAKEDDHSIPGGHEVMGLHTTSTYDELCYSIRRYFQDVQRKDAKARSNIHSIWTPGSKVEKVKAVWSYGSGWNENGPGISETVLTEMNCALVLKAIKERGNHDALSVLISADA
ncbi:hypothetical protein BDZ45DRAFT_739352 [Acephala macrosclerotiorum]|nr:hypothetical protein BDZ45DRAFT_739352 [Acephala macrosclerotiorum]